jgi:hypothetical protein
VRLALSLFYPVEDDTRPTRFRWCSRYSRRHYALQRVVAETSRCSHPRECEVLHAGIPPCCIPHLVNSVPPIIEASQRAIHNVKLVYSVGGGVGIGVPAPDGSASTGNAVRCIPNDGTVKHEVARRTRVIRDATVVTNGVSLLHTTQ